MKNLIFYFFLILLIIIFSFLIIKYIFINIIIDKFFNSNNTTVEKFLTQYKNKNVIIVPFDGNSGDAVILFGTLCMLKKLNIKYKFGNINENYFNENIIINGGGNLVGIYSDVKKIINKYQHNNKIILLPHTIKDEDELLNNLNKNTIIFCRELKSYNYTKSKAKYPNNIFIDHDMAFKIKNLEIFSNLKKDNLLSVGNCYRNDVEKTDIIIPKDNNDISQTISHPNHLKDEITNYKIVNQFFIYLSKFNTINTNRLHVAIAASLLGKNVNFYGNSYWKNKEIYNYSIKNKFNKTIFYN